MTGIELMVYEHTYILRMLKVLRAASYKVLKGEELVRSDYDKMIDFVRNYADKHHHGKEEKILFNKMVAELGPLANKLITNGMLVEHDLGRYYMSSLVKSLDSYENGDDVARIDIIANAVSYADLLSRHIKREDDVVYRFAERELKARVLKQIDLECKQFEEINQKVGVQDKYISILQQLEKKYL